MREVTTQIVPPLTPGQDRRYFRQCVMDGDPSIRSVTISHDGTSVTTEHETKAGWLSLRMARTIHFFKAGSLKSGCYRWSDDGSARIKYPLGGDWNVCKTCRRASEKYEENFAKRVVDSLR